MDIDIRALGPERRSDFIAPLITAFGFAPAPERIEAMKRLPELDVRLAAFERSLASQAAAGSARKEKIGESHREVGRRGGMCLGIRETWPRYLPGRCSRLPASIIAFA